MKKWWWSERISLVTMMLLKTKGIIWSYIGLIWPYWKSLELNYFTNIYLNECISIVLLLLLQKRTVNRSFSFRNPKESWISPFVMIVEISTEQRALNHIPFIYLIFLDFCSASIKHSGQISLFLFCCIEQKQSSCSIHNIEKSTNLCHENLIMPGLMT